MKLPALLALCCILSSFLYCQKNLKEGLVVLNNGDTLKGFIDYREWYRNPNSVLFTQSKNQATQRYAEKEISSFSVLNEESYGKYFVNISMDKLEMSALGDKDTSSRNEIVFLKILQQGKNLLLFSFTDQLKKRFYILRDGESIPVELKNSAYMYNGQVVEERQYRITLIALATKLLPGDNSLVSAIQSADYSGKTIGDICSKLNGLSKKEALKQNAGADRSRFRFFAGAGINRGSLEFTGSNHHTGNNTYPFYFPVIAAGVDIFANPATRRLFLRNQLAGTIYKTDGTAVVKYYEATENYSVKLRQTNISLHSQLCYNVYNQPALKWFIGAGAGMNFSSYPYNQETLVKETLNGGTYTSVKENYVSYIEKFWLNACFRTGVTLAKLDFSIAYFPNSSFSKHTNFDVLNSSLQLQVSILFDK